jgi:hypothetical protein
LEIHLRRSMGRQFRFDEAVASTGTGGASPLRSATPGSTATGSRALETTGRGSARALSAQTAAIITLFHDMVIVGPWSPRVGSLLLGRPAVFEGAVTVWRLNLGRAASLHWPLPPCLTFFFLDQFVFAWNDFLERIPTSTMNTVEGPQLAAFAWIAAGTGALEGQRPVQFSGDAVQPSSWSALFAALEQKIPDRNDRSTVAGLRREWLVDVALLYMPEMGLSGLPAPPQRLVSFWQSQWRLISRQRALNLASVLLATTPDLAEKLRKAPLPEFLQGERLTPRKMTVELLAQNKESEEEESEPDTPTPTSGGPPRRPRRSK